MTNSQDEVPNKQTSSQSKGSSNTALTVLLVVFGVIAVLLTGILVGSLLFGGRGDTPGSPDAPGVVPPPPSSQEPYAVAKDYVNVRSGPGIDYPAYGVAAPGQSAPVVGVSPDGGWWAIRLQSEIAPGGMGWVSTTYVDAFNTAGVPVIQPPQPVPPIYIPPVDPGSRVVVTTEAVNVRSGPGTQYLSYGVVPKGTTLEALGINQDGSWVAVRLPTTVTPQSMGWVSAAYLEAFDAAVLPLIEP